MHSSNNFPFLLSPLSGADTKANEPVMTTTKESSMVGIEHYGSFLTALSYGIVRVKSQSNKPFLFRRVIGSDVELTAFPKRTDFLHPLFETEIDNPREVDTSSTTTYPPPVCDTTDCAEEQGRDLSAKDMRPQTRVAAYEASYVFPKSECEFEHLPARYSLLAAFVPSIMHKIDVALVAQGLQNSVLSYGDSSLVIQAISAPAAREEANYNRLEFLGDSVLKFCTSLQVSAEHLNWPEGYLSMGKSIISSNNFLTKEALKIGLDRYVLTEPFTGKKWRPPTIDELLEKEEGSGREISSKIVADVVEALIGAAYVDGGLEKALICIRAILQGQEWYPHTECVDRLLSEVSPSSRLSLQLLQRLVGHNFTHKSLLLEAITHASLPSNSGYSYERLEFLGDAVLDLLVVPRIFAHPRKLREWEMHRVREAVVSGDFLGYCSMKYGVEEEVNSVTFGASQENDEPHLQPSMRKVHLHDFLRASSGMMHDKRRSLESFENYRDVVDNALEHGSEYPWADLTAMRPLKVFSDMVEAVLGALYLDARGNFSACEAFVERLGIFNIMDRILDENIETTPLKERVGIMAGNGVVEYDVGRSIAKGEEGSGGFTCVIKVDGVEVAAVEGCGSKEEAEARAAVKALQSNFMAVDKSKTFQDGAGTENVEVKSRKRRLEAEAWGDEDDRSPRERHGMDWDCEAMDCTP